MSSEIDQFSIELVKIAAEDSKKQNYASAVLAAAPFAAAKAAIDVPKGMLDKAVDGAIRTGKPKLKSIFARGVGRGLGSLGPGMVTTPVFLSGIKQLSTAKTKSDKREGTAKILGAGFAYAALKGATEAAIEKGVGNVKPKDALKIVRNIAGVRGMTGLVSSGLVAKQLAESRKGKKKDSTKSDLIAGLAIGAGKGAVDELAEKGLKAFKTPKGLRGLAARASGRAAAGAVGAVALGKIVDSYMKKTGSAPAGVFSATANYSSVIQQPPIQPTPTPSAVYDQMVSKAQTMPANSVYSAYLAHVARGNPEANPMRRAVHYALTDSLEAKGHRVPPPEMREQVAPKQVNKALPTAAMIGALAAPHAVMHYMDTLPKTDKEKLLSESLDAQILSRNIDYFRVAPDDTWSTEVRDAYATLSGKSDGLAGINPDTGKRMIMVGEAADAAVKAHELGHAAAGPLRSSLLQNNVVRRMADLGRIGTVVIPLGALFMASDKSFATPREIEAKQKFVESAGKVGALAMMPKLVEEAAASIKAVEFLRKAEMSAGAPAGEALSRALSKSLKRLGPAFLTYASPLLLPGIAAKYLSARADRAEKNLYRKVHNG